MYRIEEIDSKIQNELGLLSLIKNLVKLKISQVNGRRTSLIVKELTNSRELVVC